MAKTKDKIRIIFSILLSVCFGLASRAYATAEYKEMQKLEKMEVRQQQVQVEIIERPSVEYNAEGLRDPFDVLIAKPIIPESSQSKENTDIQEGTPPLLTVQGIIWGGMFPQAIINNKVVKVGDTVQEAQIISIEKDGITVLFKDKQFYLSSPGTEQTSKKNQKEDNNE